VLRYWETEFDQLKPQKNRAGNRIYTNKDIQLIMHIKGLLRERKYTIEGARKILEDYSSENVLQQNKVELPEEESKSFYPETKRERPSIKKDLEEIKSILELLVSKL
jgi:DNA-binding transcriptional MerR regulator